MSTFDDASLVMIPSGYKASKVYSVKPTDGTGDLTFTRTLDTATRVGADGLIEKVRTNLLLHSQDPSNAVWTKTNTTYSGDTLTAVGGLNSKFLFQAQAQQGLQTIYFDVAYVSHQFIQVFHVSGAGDAQFANFDIQNKVLGTSGGGALNATIQDFGTFVRIALVLSTTTKTTCALAFVDSASAARGASSASTGSVKVFNAQNETGDIATAYIPTTTAAVSVGMLANVPRLDYLGGGCPKLLLEPQRTNLVTFSEQLNNAAWLKTAGVTVAANSVISPDGFMDADVVTFNGAGRDIQQVVSATNGVFSFYAKGSGTIFVGIASATSLTNIFTLTADWVRIVVPFTGTSTTVFIGNYGGATATSVSLWGCQVEASATYATSYIPTLGAAVTRSADSASKDSLSVFGTNVGSFFVDAEGPFFNGVAAYLFDLSDNTSDTSNRFGMYSVTSDTMQLFTNTSTNITTSVTARKKIAVVWNGTNTKVYLNGAKVVDITYANANPTSINLNSRFTEVEHGNTKYYQVLAFPTALSDADAIALTA